MTPSRRAARALPALMFLAAGARPAAGQELTWDSLSNAGVARASSQVDSVFVDRLAAEQVVRGGDWVSYLAARLGAVPIPDSSGIRVGVDTNHVLIRGRMVDLPPDTRRLFGPLLMFADSTTTLEAEVVMAPTGPGVVRFVLTRLKVNDRPIPESILEFFLAQVGKRYPALTSSGRQLLVAVPADGRVTLLRNGVRVWIDSTGARGTANPPPPIGSGVPRPGPQPVELGADRGRPVGEDPRHTPGP